MSCHTIVGEFLEERKKLEEKAKDKGISLKGVDHMLAVADLAGKLMKKHKVDNIGGYKHLRFRLQVPGIGIKE